MSLSLGKFLIFRDQNVAGNELTTAENWKFTSLKSKLDIESLNKQTVAYPST